MRRTAKRRRSTGSRPRRGKHSRRSAAVKGHATAGESPGIHGEYFMPGVKIFTFRSSTRRQHGPTGTRKKPDRHENVMDFWQHRGRRTGSRKIVLPTTRILSALRGWLARRLQQRKARSEIRARLDLELLLHALKMREALQEAEEKVRAEIALRTRAEQQAREEAEARLEIERVARRGAERRLGR